MPKLNWDGNDFRNSQDSSGSVADNISRNGNLQQGYKHGSLTRGLVAYYPMEKGQGEVLHDGALANLGQIKGATWTTGQVGNNSLSFDGTNDWVDTSFNPNNELSSGVTFSLWLKPDNWNDGDFSGMLAGQNTNTGAYLKLGKDNKGGINWQTNDGSTKYGIENASAALTNDKWYHLVGTADTSNGYKLYLNGALLESSSDTTVSKPDTTLGIGVFARDGSYSSSDAIAGDYEEIRIYDRALSKPEIKALYNEDKGVQSGVEKKEKSVPSQNQGGISRYKLDGDATDSWGDNNGNNNGATLDATGVYGQAAQFNGSSDYISVSNDSSLETDYLTVTGWIYADSFGYNPRIVFKRQGGSEWDIAVDTENYSGNPLIINMWINGNLEQLITNSNYDMSSGVWKFVALTYDGSQINLFVNDKLVQTQEVNGTIDNSGADLIIGRGDSSWANPGYWNGRIDDVRIYDKALTPLQVEKLYHKGAYRISRESTLQ